MVHHTDTSPPLRINASVWHGILPYLSYVAVFYAMFTLVDVQYMRIGEDEASLWNWLVPPVLGGFVVALGFVVAYGWWRPALREQRKLGRGVLTIPILAVAVAVLNLVLGDFSTVTPVMIFVMIGCFLIVGFNEEMVNRGLLIVGLRSRLGETGVWLVSTAMFAVFHLPNVFYGVGEFTLFQVCVALGMGSVFYLTRRATGSLVFSMLLHALWDFSSFSAHAPYLGLASPLLGITAVIVAIVVLGRERRGLRAAAK